MNPDKPSREQIEARITALLLGELPADEAELLRWTISQDPELQKLHARLLLTVGLVREALAHSAETDEKSAPMKLSDERREQLLAHFKTPRPEFVMPVNRGKSFWVKQLQPPSLISLLVVVAIVALLAAMMLPALSRAKNKAMRATSLARISNLSGDEEKTQSRDIAGPQGAVTATPPHRLPGGEPAINQVVDQAAVTPLSVAPVTPPPPAEIVLPKTEPSQVAGTVYPATMFGYANVPNNSGAPSATPADSFATGNAVVGSGFARGGGAGGGGGGGGEDYVVKSGDTLTKIAKEHGTTVQALEVANNLSTTKIRAGEKMKMPAEAEATAPAPQIQTPALAFDDTGVNRSTDLNNLGEVSRRKGPVATAAPAYTFSAENAVASTAPVNKKDSDQDFTGYFGAKQAEAKPSPDTSDHRIVAQGNLQLQPSRSATITEGEQVPVLGDVPASGRLFQSKSGTSTVEAFDTATPATTPSSPGSSFQQRLAGIENRAASPATAGGDVMLEFSGKGESAKSDNGTLTLNGNNSFADGTTVNAGRISSINGVVVPGQTITVNSGVTRDDANGLRYLFETNNVALADSERQKFRSNLNISDTDPNSIGPSPTLTQEMLQQLHSLQIEEQKNYAKLSTTLAELQALQQTNPAQLRDILPTITSDNALSGLLNKLHQAEQNGSKSSIATLNQQIDDRVRGIMIGLDAETKSTKAALDETAARIESAEENRVVQKPQQPAPIPQPEILTRENNFSTFSLNVSDVSFKLAAASLEKGKLPDAASIRSEEFINAFDYRDPEAKWDSASSLSAQTGKMPVPQPVAFASERARYPFAHNRDLLRFSVKTAAAGRQAGRALNLVLLLDTSGSMERADRVVIVREALRVLATQLQPQDTVSVVTFARTARLWADGVSGDKAGETLSQVGGITPDGGTNLEEAMRLAYETARRHYLANGMNRVVLLTDGAANLGNVDPNVLKQKVEAQRKQGIALDCFGIGWEDFDDTMLEELSGNGDGRYAFINSPEEAAKDFAAKLAGALQVAAQDVKVQVEFNPQRVISWRQIGYAKHQLTKEQFRDNSVIAAEIAAQEAGNALYTVETRPDGIGPIATVRVRYRVPGTQDFYERSWNVDYTGTAPALEQSSPAMRLAATASAFSEWLAASPFAQEVTPDELLKDLSGVPQVYGVDQRPAKLETMIRETKSVSGK